MSLRRLPTLARAVSGFALLAFVVACSNQATRESAQQETQRYVAHARGNYVPPGPANDPWGPYIREASTRFDMPEKWVRSLMKVESGGRLYASNGQLITSHAGAMGLMQVMPGTYGELRERHNLGDDPFHPRDNILAGVAYMREMYDMYGAPGFLAAYNAGPARLDDYLTNNRPLPDETRKYVAMISPNLAGASPVIRSPAEQYAMNALPTNIAPGLRYGRATQVASANAGAGRVPTRAPIEVAQLPETARPVAQQQIAAVIPPPVPAQSALSPAQRQQLAALQQPAPVAAAPERPRFQLIPSANASESNPQRRGNAASTSAFAASSGQWAIQVGAFANQAQAQAALGSARDQARGELAGAQTQVATVRQPRGVLWRARLTGLSRESALQACGKISRGRANCIVLSPDAQG